MWHRGLLVGTALWLAGTLPAGAFIAYVSNEKSNTVSVIDTDKSVSYTHLTLPTIYSV